MHAVPFSPHGEASLSDHGGARSSEKKSLTPKWSKLNLDNCGLCTGRYLACPGGFEEALQLLSISGVVFVQMVTDRAVPLFGMQHFASLRKCKSSKQA